MSAVKSGSVLASPLPASAASLGHVALSPLEAPPPPPPGAKRNGHKVCGPASVPLGEESVAVAANMMDREPFTRPTPSRLGKFKSAAISSDGAECSMVGRDVLADGGNAMDAAIAALFVNAVVNPQSAGLGGGFHMTVYDPATGVARCLDARETAPAAATRDMFAGRETLSQLGGLAVAVPGELAGYWAAHQAYGKLAWSRLVLPAADLAEKGVAVNRHLAGALERLAAIVESEPSMRFLLNEKTGKVLEFGDTLKNPALGRTLRLVASEGPQVFYNGRIGHLLVEDVRHKCGILTKEDLQQYKVDWVEPIRVELKGNLTLYSMPPPGSGVLTAYIMKTLDEYFYGADAAAASKDPVTYQRIAEAFKHAYGQRTKLGDPKFVPEVREWSKSLTSDHMAEQTRKQIDEKVASGTSTEPSYYGAFAYGPNDSGTSHVSVIDPSGLAVSVTSTINLHLGAGFASERTGIVLNNEMDDFSFPHGTSSYGLPPCPANFIAPGKRPLSSMAPMIVVDSSTGRVRLAIGAAGGIRITSGAVYATIRHLRFGESIKEAIDSRRFHHQLLPMELQCESGFPKGIADSLIGKGHALVDEPREAAVYGVSVEPDGFLYANADYRKGGDVDGLDGDDGDDGDSDAPKTNGDHAA